MTEEFFVVMGWVAVVVLIFPTWAQVRANWKSKSTGGVSVGGYVTLFVGMIMLFVLSLHDATVWPIRVQFLLGVIGSGVVLWQMYIYRKGEKRGR